MRLVQALLISILLASSIMIIPTLVMPAAEDDGRITVMTYNIHQWFVADSGEATDKTGAYIFRELLSVIEDANPDIIGLQESEGARFSSGNVQGVAWLAEQLGMYYYYGGPTQEQLYGNAILSFWPIVETAYEIYPRPEGIERAMVQVSIDSPYGLLRMFNTHIEISRFDMAQKASILRLIDAVGDEPAIITGDFNVAASRNQEGYFLMNDTFTYAMLEAGIPVNDSRGFTAPAGDPRAKIDYIWLSKGDWQVFPDSFKVVGNPDASDHLAVVVDILPL
ncbi:MAG: endonuclease/exonuclease/phosphatase family protein [Candidatus Kariarchaeaceae archaeon]|jgi:endonuclease/exonuclease/phosphatase family metal-dependent hydrolase